MRGWIAIGVLTLLPVPGLAAGGPPPGDRSIELVRMDCRTTVRRREVTLFANGTIRLRDGRLGDEALGLSELGPIELEGVEHRLSAEEINQADRQAVGPTGDWVERCQLVLSLPQRSLQVIHFGRYDALPLGLDRIVKIVDGLCDKVKDLQASDRLPPGYTPAPGDVLRRFDGQLYRVVRFTDDSRAVEFEGVDQPFELFVPVGEINHEFKMLISHKP